MRTQNEQQLAGELGLPEGTTRDELKAAGAKRLEELEGRVAAAPTPALRKKLQAEHDRVAGLLAGLDVASAANGGAAGSGAASSGG